MKIITSTLLAILLSMIVCLPFYLWLYGPDSAYNVGDIVMGGWGVAAFSIPTYASALEREGAWIQEMESDDDLIHYRLAVIYSQATVERIETLRIHLNELSR